MGEHVVLKFAVGLPPVQLSPNARVHWAAKSKAVHAYREEAWAAAMEAKAQVSFRRFTRATISLTFCCGGPKIRGYSDGRYRPRDADNALASAKALIDGIVQAGLLRSDSRQYLSIESPTILRSYKEHRSRQRVLVTLEGEVE